MLNTTVSNLCENLNGDKYHVKFYWEIVGGICRRIISDDHHYDLNIYKELGPVHHRMQGKASNHLSLISSDVKAYRAFVDVVQENFSMMKSEIEAQNINFDEISNQLRKYDLEKSVADSFGFKNMLVDQSKLQKMRQSFIECHQEISHLLIIVSPQQNW